MEQKIKQIIADKLGCDIGEVTEDKDLVNDLGADSLDMVELEMDFEKEYDITITYEEAENIRTVKQIIEYIKTK